MGKVTTFTPADELMGFRVWIYRAMATEPRLTPFVYTGYSPSISKHFFKTLKGKVFVSFTVHQLQAAVEQRRFFPAVYTKENSGGF